MFFRFFKHFFQKDDVFSQTKKTEKECFALKKEFSKKLTNLEKAELIIDYLYNLDSRYMLYDDFYEWNKKMEYKERVLFVINTCKNANDQRKLFLLSLAYHRLGIEYTDYCIYYMKLFLNNKSGFIKKMPKCKNNIENYNYQISMIHYLISVKYKDNLNFDMALKHAFMSKGMNEKFPRKFNPYCNISEILYKKGDLNNAIKNIYEGLRNTNDKYEKEALCELLKKYENYKKNDKKYKIVNKKRPRYDVKTGLLYDLTTGEIIK